VQSAPRWYVGWRLTIDFDEVEYRVEVPHPAMKEARCPA
jgi:hypothetical protein